MKNMQPTTNDVDPVFQYSNYLVTAAGYAAARAYVPDGPLSDAFIAAMTDLIFQPLGMHDTCLGHEHANAALPHSVDFDGKTVPIPVELEAFCDSVQPAGGVWSTAPDLCKYLLLELGRGRLPRGERLMSENAICERRIRRVTVDEKSSYGLGLLLSDENGTHVVRHPGNTFGFSADLCFFPEKDLGFVFLANQGMAVHLTTAVRQKVTELAFGAEPKADATLEVAIKKRAWTTRMNSAVLRNAESMTWIDALLGTYYSEEFGTADLVTKDGLYWMEFEEWASAIGCQTRYDGARLLYMTTPPWFVGQFVVSEAGELVLDNDHIRCVFRKRGTHEHCLVSSVRHGDQQTAAD
jgi:CubicO group peptidase (beta-lactamase class C family)